MADWLTRQGRRVAPLAHALLLFRLRVESWVARLFWPRAPRVAATACWTFPIYSQTFVHQEVAAMADAGFAVRFLYSELGPRSELARAAAALWPRKRRLLLTAATAATDYAYYRQRMPERVEAVLDRLAEASGLTRSEIDAHEHVQHAFSFTRAVDAWGADYVHSYFFYERSLFAFVASQLLEKPRGVSCYADHLMRDYPLKLVALQLRTCDVAIATSRRIRSELESVSGGALPAALVKPNAIDTSRFTPRRRPFVTGGLLRLLCVSRIDPKKGLEYLVDALPLLQARGFAVELRIVGAPDAHAPESQRYLEMLEAKVSGLGLDAVVRFEGRRSSDDVREYLDAAHVFVAPFVELANGDKDGIPTAVLEAMAAGSAIVASTAGSIDEIIANGREGLLVGQRDSAALADAVARLATDSELAGRLGDAAAARARHEFDVASSEREFHERIRALVEHRRAVPRAVGVTP